MKEKWPVVRQWLSVAGFLLLAGFLIKSLFLAILISVILFLKYLGFKASAGVVYAVTGLIIAALLFNREKITEKFKEIAELFRREEAIV